MGRSKSVIVGNRYFRSKKEATEYIRDLARRYQPSTTVSSEDDEQFLYDLIALHPESDAKCGCGIVSFQVELNQYDTRGFWLTRRDGSRTDFSFISCLTPPSHEQDVRRAFREEIADQITAFRDEQLVVGARCALTGIVLDGLRAHVDHEPTFKLLVDRFTTEHGLVFAELRVNDTTDQCTRTWLADRGVAATWQSFHRRHACLRLVSAKANLSRGAR